WLDAAESNNQFRMAVLGSVDELPASHLASPNAYIITGVDQRQSSFIAYTDRTGLWNFDAYDFAYQAQVPITAVDQQSITIALSDYTSGMNPSYIGQIIVEFSTGQNFSFCRYVKSVILGPTTATFQLTSPMAQLPVVGDKIVIFGRQVLSTTIPNLPIATHTDLGAVIVGQTLTVDNTGLINVAPSAFPVTSVNGKTGDVELKIGDIPDAARVAATGDYNDLINKPVPYSLPVANTTTLGGVKASTNGHITIASDGTLDIGFAPVLKVNNITPDASGNVSITFPPVVGLVNPTQIPNAADLNTYTSTGLYYVLPADSPSLANGPGTATGRKAAMLEVEALSTSGTTGDLVQRWQGMDSMYFRSRISGTWSGWLQLSNGSLPPATTSTLGAVIVGAGLNVTSSGLLSTQIQSVNGKTDQYLVLTANDVGAIPSDQIDKPGGVAGLSAIPNGSSNPTDNYVYGRIKNTKLPLGAVYIVGNFDANANHVSQYAGLNTIDTNTALLASGMQTIDTGYNATNPFYQTVPANGSAYLVTVAGTTALDGITSWA
ncbi:TPA: hypothetical protein RMT47_005060, partial [Escherichia coli]|nr:hypothetical protein [Escherichia coli]